MLSEAIALLASRKPTWTRELNLDFVRLKHDGVRWHARFRQKDGTDVKRQLPKSFTDDDAKEWARETNERIRHERGLLPSLRNRWASSVPIGLPVEEALRYALDNCSHAGAKARANYETEVGIFLQWLSTFDPAATHWVQLTRNTWRAYDREVKSRRDTALSQINAWKPLKMVSRWLSTDEGEVYKDEIAAAGLKITGRKPRRESLSIEQLFFLLDWAKNHAPPLYPLFALQGLSGLRVLEAISLRCQDVDLLRGQIRVTSIEEGHGLEAHGVKTDESERTLPISGVLLELLQEYASSRSESSPKAPFLIRNGAAWTEGSFLSYTRYWVKQLRRDLRDVCDFPERFTPRHLRTTFNNLARFEAGVDRPALIRYLGRSPKDETARSYEMYTVTALRDLVAKPWNKFVETRWKDWRSVSASADTDQRISR